MSTQGLWIWSMPTFSFFQCHLSTTSVLERRAAKRFVLYTPATAISDNALFLINGLETCKATNAADKPSSARSRSLVSLPKHLGNLQPWPYLWSPDPNYLITSIFCWQEGMRDISLWSKPTGFMECYACSKCKITLSSFAPEFQQFCTPNIANSS